MSEIETTYRQLLKERDTQSLQDFMDTPEEGIVEEPVTPKPDVKAEEKPSPIGAGAKRLVETGAQGIKHFMNGVNRVAQSTADPSNSGVESLYGFGEVALGGLTLMMALPAGAGVAFREAVKTYAPGLDKTVAISGDKAAMIRFGLGLPSILLDPEIHKTIRGDPDQTPQQRIEARDALMAEMKKDMTYGELLEIGAMFAAPGLAIRVMKGRPTSEPLRVQEAAGVKPPAQGMAPGKRTSTLTPEDAAARAEQVMTEMGGKKAEGAALAAEGAKPAKKPKKAKTEEPAAEPKPFSEEEHAPYTQEWASQLDHATTRAEEIILEEVAQDPELAKIFKKPVMQTAEGRKASAIEDILAEEFPDPIRETKDIKALQDRKAALEAMSAEELMAVPRGAATVEEAAGPLAAKLEDLQKLAVKEPAARVAPDEIIQRVEKEFPDLTGAEKEAKINELAGVPGGEVRALRPEAQGKRHPLEVKTEGMTFEKAQAIELEIQGKVAKLQKDAPYTITEGKPAFKGDKNFVVDFGESSMTPGTGKRERYIIQDPEHVQDIVDMRNEAIDIARQAEEMRTAPGKTSRAKGRAEKSKAPKLTSHEGERGSIDPNLLARMAVGAVIGGSMGDTPEDRVKYALLGLLGGAIAPKVAKRFVAAMRAEAPHLVDPSAPRVPTFSRTEVTDTTNRVIDRAAGKQRKTVERVLSIEEGDKLSVDELKIIKQVEMKAWEDVKNLAEAYGREEPVPAGELRETLALARVLNDQVTVAGRRMGATGARGMERVKVAIGRVNDLAREWDPATSEANLAAAIREVGPIENVAAFSRLYFAVPEALTQTMYGTMLLGKALIKNGVGNAAMVPVSILDRSFASLKYRDPAFTMSVAQQGFIAMWEGVLDQLRMIRNWDKLGEQADVMGGSHIEVSPRGWEAMSDIAMEGGHEGVATALDWVNSASNLAPEIMRRTDGMSKAVHGQMAIHWEAMEKARAEGLQGEAFDTRVRELVQNYDQLGPEALLRIKEHRDHMTFTRQFESDLMQALQAGPSDPWLNLAYRMSVAPFVRTPVRLYDVGAEYTPGLNFLSAQFRREMRAGGTRRTTAEARLATGALIIGSFMYLANKGYVTGSMPSDPDEVKAMTAAGRPPQSVWDPLSQKMRSYKGIEPLTQWISTGADLSLMVGQLSEKSAEKLITAASLAIANNININQFMQAISEMTDVMKNGRTDSQFEKSLEFIRRRLSAFIPAVAKELTGAGEEKTRTMYDPRFDEGKGVINSAHRELRALMDDVRKGFGADQPAEEGRAPFIKRQRNMFTGVPLTNDVWPGNPFTTVPDQPAPWAKEIQRLHGAGLKPLDEWMGRPQASDIGVQSRRTAPGVRMYPQELDRQEVLMTQEIKIGGKKLTESWDDLVTSPRYQNVPDFTKQDLIQERWHEFRDASQRKLLLEDKELRNRYRLQKGESMIEKLPSTRQPQLRENIHRRYGPGVAP